MVAAPLLSKSKVNAMRGISSTWLTHAEKWIKNAWDQLGLFQFRALNISDPYERVIQMFTQTL